MAEFRVLFVFSLPAGARAAIVLIHLKHTERGNQTSSSFPRFSLQTLQTISNKSFATAQLSLPTANTPGESLTFLVRSWFKRPSGKMCSMGQLFRRTIYFHSDSARLAVMHLTRPLYFDRALVLTIFHFPSAYFTLATDKRAFAVGFARNNFMNYSTYAPRRHGGLRR